jgi:hypothetical protein
MYRYEIVGIGLQMQPLEVVDYIDMKTKSVWLLCQIYCICI